MEFLRQLFHGKGYIDGITIINLDGEILFSAKLNSKFSNRKEREAYQALVGQNFFDVFENLNAKNSSMIRAMEVGLPVYVENQLLQTKGQEGIHISSLSIPIKSGRAVVGAIDLSMEEMTDGEEEPESVELTSEQIPVGGAGKLKKHSGASFTMEDIIAVDEKMKNARDYIPVVAACDLPVMIYGETGTGKEVFAQSIHNASERRDKPFIAQNCAALPDTLLESILFGTSKGAFTGAMENKGLFELADGGTLFLDEINSMPLFLQSKLLPRHIQNPRCLRYISVRRLQCLPNQFFLIGSHRLTKRRAEFWNFFQAFRRLFPVRLLFQQKLSLDVFILEQGARLVHHAHAVNDHVFQLPDIARPVIFFQFF